MNKKVSIVQGKQLSDFKSIDEYLLHTYGEKKLAQSLVNCEPTFLDVIGYTLDKRGFETVEANSYELEEIEVMMVGTLENVEEDSYC
ncbi:hypothetical protein BRE01_62340 [Brevibacillus reuszeri]|uniref:Uncharacterized protein n=1 Tax=Brevibacillus reuszeri TaxID=54915 RepID=A0ABQ0TX95_9BACL|nr:hypothetical protein [Brevibacillus reuszeri]GED72532.1 hypothetical protein BRE01_62340 [Brevibacillus reuszeri]